MLAILNGSAIDTKEALHSELIRALPLPEWYGKNLDALYDCLTDLSDPTEILLLHAAAMERALGDYALRFERVLRDAAEENRRLTVTRIAN